MIKKSRDPRWDEEFQFMLEDAPVDEKIHIEVLSKRRFFVLHSKVRNVPILSAACCNFLDYFYVKCSVYMFVGITGTR